MIFVSDHAFISKWWWIGTIRNTRLPVRLKLAIWMIHVTASITNTPPMKTSSTSVSVRIASVAIAPPSAIEPVSPMNISAGNALNQRNPITPPISAAATIAMSRYSSLRAATVSAERIQSIDAIARSVISEIAHVPAARPSIPSVRLTAFEVPAMTRKRNG